MESWDVVLCVGDSKFYAHKTILSFASSMFRTMFERDFREKNQQEVPVKGQTRVTSKPEFIVPLVTLADFYNVKPPIEKYVEMLKVLPNVSNVDKLRVAIKVNSTSLEDIRIASLSKADIDELIAAGFKDLGDNRWQKIVAKCHSMIP
ncbi:hypothetical protein AAVH_27542 [Aphelenchoides avenae]|nr:hypothetical protein AAVH_27542 [Aphelenchus avenae]